MTQFEHTYSECDGAFVGRRARKGAAARRRADHQVDAAFSSEAASDRRHQPLARKIFRSR